MRKAAQCFWRQFAAPTDDARQIEEHDYDYWSHQYRMPSAAAKMVVGRNVVHDCCALGDSQQDEVYTPQDDGGAEKPAILPSFPRCVQQESGEHRQGQREKEIFKIDGDPAHCCHVWILPHQAINEKRHHAQHDRRKKPHEETPVPAIRTGHDGGNHQTRRS